MNVHDGSARGRRVVLPNDAKAPSQARRYVADRLAGWPSELVERAVLGASEIVTNALIHGLAPRWIAAYTDSDCAVVRVGDASDSEPVVRAPTEAEHTGRGLQIVESVVDRWGVERVPDEGKVVWFEISR